MTERGGMEIIGIMLGHCAVQKGCVYVGMARFLLDIFAGKELDINKIEIFDIPEYEMQIPIEKVNKKWGLNSIVTNIF